MRDWEDAESSCAALDDGSCEVYGDTDARAALDAGFFDERIDAIVPQAGAATGYLEGEFAAIELPTMWMTARLDATLSWDDHGSPGWEALDGANDVWIDLTRGGHHSFHAACEEVDIAILDGIGLNVSEDGCGEDFTPIAEIVPVVQAYIHAFARLHILGEPVWRGVFTSPPLHAEVEITTR
jgi:hypothetical protein